MLGQFVGGNERKLTGIVIFRVYNTINNDTIDVILVPVTSVSYHGLKSNNQHTGNMAAKLMQSS